MGIAFTGNTPPPTRGLSVLMPGFASACRSAASAAMHSHRNMPTNSRRRRTQGCGLWRHLRHRPYTDLRKGQRPLTRTFRLSTARAANKGPQPPLNCDRKPGFFEVVGREGFEPSTYGLRVRVTPILMRRKPKIPKRFSAGCPAPRPKPNLSRTPFRWRSVFLDAGRTKTSSCANFRPTRPRTMQRGAPRTVAGAPASRVPRAGQRQQADSNAIESCSLLRKIQNFV